MRPRLRSRVTDDDEAELRRRRYGQRALELPDLLAPQQRASDEEKRVDVRLNVQRVGGYEQRRPVDDNQVDQFPDPQVREETRPGSA